MFSICGVKSKGICTDLEKGKRNQRWLPEGMMPDALGRVKMSWSGKSILARRKGCCKDTAKPELWAPVSEEIRPLNSESTGGRSGKRLDGMEISQSIRKMTGNGSPRGERMLQGPERELWVTPFS